MRVVAHIVSISASLMLIACGDEGSHNSDTSANDASASDAADTSVTQPSDGSTVPSTSVSDADASATEFDVDDVDVPTDVGDATSTGPSPETFVDADTVEDVEASEEVEVTPPELGCQLTLSTTHVYAGGAVTPEVRVSVPGLTDQSAGIDASDELLIELGRGTPVVYDDALEAMAIDPWDDPFVDGYRFTVTIDAPVSFGARISNDGGETWHVCEGAPHVEAVADPCALSPCELPAPVCEGTVVVSFDGDATCDPGPASAPARTCHFEHEGRDDCADDFEVCKNAACTSPAVTCNVVPASVELYADQSTIGRARLSVETRTSVSDGVDAWPGLRVEWTIGTDDVWSAAAANASWSASAAGAPGVDEWLAAIDAPDETTSYRFRVSLDAGETWAACGGAGVIELVPDPCAGNPCGNVIPEATCDGDSVLTYDHPPTCVRAPQAGTPPSCIPQQATTTPCPDARRCHEGRCEPPDVWCRLQFPETVTLYGDESATAYARVYVEGLTPEDDQLDPPDYVKVEAGIAPASSEPSFVWSAALPNPGWTGASEPANLEWMALLAAPDVAANYLYAFRVSLDDGTTWTLCDRDGGDGHDGAEDGFQPSLAGVMQVVADPCVPNACHAPNGCEGQTLVTYPTTPTCTRPANHSGGPNCNYGNATRTDCSANGKACDATLLQCVTDDPCEASPCTTPPTATCDGNTVVTYGLPASCNGGLCSYAETRTPCTGMNVCDAGACRAPATWCRLQYPYNAPRYNVDDSVRTYGRFYVEGLTDKTNRNDANASVRFEWGVVSYTDAATVPNDSWRWHAATPNPDYVAFDEPNNDEWMYDWSEPALLGWIYRYVYRLSIDNGQTWKYCDFDFGDGHDGSEDGYQEIYAGFSNITGDNCQVPTFCNEPPTACQGNSLLTYQEDPICTRPEFPGDIFDSYECDYGDPTPIDCTATGKVCNAQREECRRPLPWCRLQYPPDVSLLPDQSATAYARVYLPGITTATAQNDVDASLEVQLGTGASDSSPLTWTQWSTATPNAGWNGANVGEPNNDEYQATLTGGPIGTLAYAFRARWTGSDGPNDWVYCDRDFGSGMDGAEDGYQVDRAGTLRRLGDPCAVNPCTTPPPGTCNGNVLTPKKVPGVCTAVNFEAHCEYPDNGTPVDCASFTATCTGGVCDARDAFCRLQYPDSATLISGQSTTVYGRYYVAGVTDRSRNNDSDPYVVGELGYGPHGTHPASWPDGQWVAALPNPGYLAPELGNERNNDELQANLVAPDEGCDVSYAYRVSTDGGRTWTYCDRNTGVGQDGSEDGFQPGRAGSLRVLPGPVAIRITDFELDYSSSHPSVVNMGFSVEQELDAAVSSGALNLVLDLEPFPGSKGKLGLHDGIQVDAQCNRQFSQCDWRVPLSGLDDETCQADTRMDYDYGAGQLRSTSLYVPYVLHGDIPLYGVSFFLSYVQILPDGTIGNVEGSLFGSFSASDFAGLGGQGDIDGDGDHAFDEYSVRFAIRGVGGRIVGAQ